MTVKQVKFKTIKSIVLMILLPLTAAFAQDTLTVSLSRALEISLSESPTIKVANKEIQRVDYSKKERIAGLFPNISASGSYQRSLKKQKVFFTIPGMPENPDGFEMGQDNTFSGGISASLPIIAPALWATLEMSDIDAELALESARASKQSLINQVTKAYYGVLMAQDSYNVFKKSYDNTGENSRIIHDKFKQGVLN